MTMSVYLSALSVTNLISRMPAAVAQGIIWGLMALGVFITFRLLDIPDMTVDGSFATGGAVTVMLLLAGMPAWAALLIAIVVGELTGLCTGLQHTKLGIPAILAGILTQFALYSINLRIMTKANQTASVQKFGMFWENGNGFLVSSLHIPQAILVGLVLAAIIVALSYWYFGTEQGSALRATGNNPAMSRAQGIHIGTQQDGLAGLFAACQRNDTSLAAVLRLIAHFRQRLLDQFLRVGQIEAHLRVAMERPTPLLQLRLQCAGLLQKLFRCDIHTHPLRLF